jgi:hypothetical protein
MRIVSAKQFHDQPSRLMHSKESLVITRHGKEVIGVFLPLQSAEFPEELEWKMCKALALQFGKHLKHRGIHEEEVLKQVQNWRNEIRTSGR